VDFDSSESANLPLLTVTYQGMQPIETKTLSGTSGSVTFSTLTLNDQTDYIWNCLIRSTDGQKTWETWAPVDSHFRLDSQAPDEPALVAPPDGATGISTSPTLEVTASDPQDDSLNVTFYGRTVPTSDDYFTIVVLPDTQYYSRDNPAIFDAQTQWIVDNASSYNIVFVTHEGDIVENWNNTTEWANANYSMSILDGSVPYGLLPGNHDKFTDTTQGIYPDYLTDSTYYNQTFPWTRYQSQSWYGGNYPEGKNDNSFQLFTAGGDDYIILHLEDTPSNSVITWAGSILAAHADRKAIITTHGYIDTSGNYIGKYGSTQYIWNNLVAPSSNVYLVFCAHYTGELARTKTATDGHNLYEILADYHADGWLRIMRFVPEENKVYVKTYSPWLVQYQTDNNSRFTLNFPMNEFVVIGTDTGVPSGQNASMVWSGLSIGAKYEWYVEAADPTARTRVSPVWSFTASTTDSTPPIITEVAAINVTDTAATITWTTDEASNSVVRYGTTTDLGSEASDAAMVISHSITLAGLTPGTAYYYEAQSTDATGNAAIDDNSGAYYSFTTEVPDTQPPEITNATGNTPGTTGEPVTISATIKDNKAVTVATLHHTPIDSIETTLPMTQGSDNIWSVDIPVAPNKVGTVTYYITAQDAAGNTARDPVSGAYDIAVTDNDAPSKITDLTATAVAGGSINLAWSAATDNIAVAGYNIYRDIAPIMDVTGLTPLAAGVIETSYTDAATIHGTTYYYAVAGLDSASNRGGVSNSPSATADAAGPAITAVASSGVTYSSATITWTTDELSDSVVKYGTATPPTSQASDAAMVTGHSITLTGLSAGTTYYYEVQSTDSVGNTTFDNDGGAYYSFTTTAPDTQPPVITGATGNTSGTTGEPVTISATITDNIGVVGATVRYTPIDGSETTTPMTQGGGNLWSTDVPVAPNKVGTVTYYIIAQDAAGNTARDPVTGVYDIAVTDNDAPSRITDLTATAVAGGKINLGWSAATDNIAVASYNIYRDTTQIIDLAGRTPIATDVTGTTYTDSATVDGMTYWYAVTAIDTANNRAEVSNSPSATAFYAATLFSDGFESGNFTAGGWTVSSASIKNTGAYSGTYCAQLKKAGSIRKSVSTSGSTNIHIKYARSTKALDAGEYLYVEWSINGSTWNLLEATRDTTWIYKDLVCPAGADNKTGFMIRFRTNGNRTDEFGYVDEVVVTGMAL
jgi:hypothetical protein